MKGWKTKTGGIMLAISTILGAFGQQQEAQAVAESVAVLEPIQAVIGSIGALLAVFGIGHKIEKNK